MQRAERLLPPNVVSRDDAEQLALLVGEAMARLEAVVAEETRLLKDYNLVDALELMSPKSEAGRGYVQALDMLKANAVALGRWAPAMVQDLKRAQARLTDVLNVNMAVLATARSVSEGIVRSLATEVAAPRTLTTYGAGGRAMTPPRSSATPLTISRSL